jgi:hypothetical protein
MCVVAKKSFPSTSQQFSIDRRYGGLRRCVVATARERRQENFFIFICLQIKKYIHLKICKIIPIPPGGYIGTPTPGTPTPAETIAVGTLV